MKMTKELAADSLFVAFAIWALVLASPGTLLAQQSSPPPKERELIMRAKARLMTETLNQRASELGLVSVPDDEQAEFFRQRLERQLLEDLMKLDSIHADKLAALDYKSLSETTADLKNRATRIKYNVPILMASTKIEKPRYEESPELLPLMIPELSHLIDSFLGSPIFRESSAKDAELRAKAVRDLEGIIVLSDTISKVARKMNKVAATNK